MIIAFDVGGTKILGAQFDKNMQIVTQQKWSADANDSLENYLIHLKKCIAHLLTPDTIAICLGFPSIIDDGVIIRSTNITCLQNVPIKKILEAEFDISVFINNDANCFALAAARHTKGRDVVGVTLGTGLGVGLVLNGELYSGVTQGAGEIWQLPYKESILENYVCSKYFSQKKIDAKEAHSLPDKERFELFDEYAQNLSDVLAYIIFIYNPQSIVLGGSLTKLSEFYEERTLKLLRNKVVDDQFLKTTIIFWQEATAGVVGAALLSKLYTQ